MRNPYIVGKHCYLRHPTQDDANGSWHEWFSDENTTRYLNARYWPNSIESQNSFYQSILNQKDRLVLSIVDNKTDEHIGICNLSNINWVHRFSDVALIIGHKDFRSGPFAVESISLLLRVAFEKLNLRIVKSDYVKTNISSELIHRLFCFEKTGQIDDIFWNGNCYVPSVQMILRKEVWQERKKKSE